MRHLVDLQTEIAIIEWSVKNVYPDDTYQRYKALYLWRGKTSVEEEEFAHLAKTIGKVVTVIDSVTFVHTGQPATPLYINGHKLTLIENALAILRSVTEKDICTLGCEEFD